MSLVVFSLLMWILPTFVGYKIGLRKDRAGWAWGLVLGWIGVFVVACLGPATSKKYA